MATNSFSLVRHGKVNGKPALYGHTDVALSSEGRNDLRKCLDNLHNNLNCNSITTSPLIRCAEIAHEFSTTHRISLDTNVNFREMNFGDWDGVDFDKLNKDWSQLEAFWNAPALVKPPQGETLDAFAERVITAWQTFVATKKNSHNNHHILITHGGVIRIIVAYILQIDWRNANLFQQLHINYASHTRIELSDYENTLAVIKWIGAQS